MEENLKWIWYAFSAGWIVHILYVLSLSMRGKNLQRELADLRTQLDEMERRGAKG
jgi:hypothetical protein